jgi:hypothetical protein
MLDLCVPCKDKGKFRAIYKIVKGVPMCGGCVADYEANPPEEKKPQALQFLEEVKKEKERAPVLAGAREKNMLDPKTIEAIKSDESKLSLSEICEKHGVSWPTAKRYAPNAVSKKGKKPAGGGDTSTTSSRAASTARTRPTRAKHVSKNGASSGSVSDLVGRLREHRDLIDRVITSLEDVSGL